MIFAQSIIFVLSFVNLAKACIETIVAYHISDFEIFLNFSKRPLLWTETWLAELPKVLNYFESHRQWVQGQTQDQSGSEFMPEEINKCHTTLLNTGPITNQTVSRQSVKDQHWSKNIGVSDSLNKVPRSQYQKSYDFHGTMHQNKTVCLFQNNLIWEFQDKGQRSDGRFLYSTNFLT